MREPWTSPQRKQDKFREEGEEREICRNIFVFWDLETLFYFIFFALSSPRFKIRVRIDIRFGAEVDILSGDILCLGLYWILWTKTTSL